MGGKCIESKSAAEEKAPVAVEKPATQLPRKAPDVEEIEGAPVAEENASAKEEKPSSSSSAAKEDIRLSDLKGKWEALVTSKKGSFCIKWQLLADGRAIDQTGRLRHTACLQETVLPNGTREVKRNDDWFINLQESSLDHLIWAHPTLKDVSANWTRLQDAEGEEVDDAELHAQLWYNHISSSAGSLDRLPADGQPRPTPWFYWEQVHEAFRDGDTKMLQFLLWPLVINASWARRKNVQRFLKPQFLREAEKMMSIINDFRAENGEQTVMVNGGKTFAHSVAARCPRLGGAYELMILLDKMGVDIFKRDVLRQSPLFYAARHGSVECAAYLISRGARVDIIDCARQTALFYAVLNEGQTSFQTVENYRGPRRLRDTKDANKIAHNKNRLALIDLLLSAKCDPSHKDNKGRTALDLCIDPALKNHLQVRVSELAQGAVLDKPPSDHMPPVRPPFLYLSQLNAEAQEQYMICSPTKDDVAQLTKLETEFISEHQVLLEEAFPLSEVCNPPTEKITAGTIGLDLTPAKRYETIRDVDCRGQAHYCTLKATCINYSGDSLVSELLSGARQDIVGYVALDCTNYKAECRARAKDAFANGTHHAQYRDSKHTFPQVAVRYLKVERGKLKRRIATTLFCGMLEHLRRCELELCIRDIRINFFSNNKRARQLYEKFGFIELRSSWNPVKPWQYSAQEMQQGGLSQAEKDQIKYGKNRATNERFIRWTGYRRLDLGHTGTAAGLIVAIEAGKGKVVTQMEISDEDTRDEPKAEKRRKTEKAQDATEGDAVVDDQSADAASSSSSADRVDRLEDHTGEATAAAPAPAAAALAAPAASVAAGDREARTPRRARRRPGASSAEPAELMPEAGEYARLHNLEESNIETYHHFRRQRLQAAEEAVHESPARQRTRPVASGKASPRGLAASRKRQATSAPEAVPGVDDA